MPAKVIDLDPKELENPDGSFINGGVAIRVPGYRTNYSIPGDPQIWIEVYEGKLRVHVWGGVDSKVSPAQNATDCHSIEIEPEEQ